MKRTGVLLLVAMLSLACGSPDRSRCESVPNATLRAIEQGAETSFTISEAQAVRSRDFKKIWFVSGRVERTTGTWATNDLEVGEHGVGLIEAVDERARTLTIGGPPAARASP
jgi:hypothetical protein